MNKIILIFITICTTICIANHSTFAQSEATQIKNAIQHFKKIKEWIKNDDIDNLANNIVYPFERRGASISVINNSTNFKLNYSTIFDASMKEKIAHMTFEEWRFLTHYNGNVGFDLGQIWITPQGKIKDIFFLSNAEQGIFEPGSDDELKSIIHSSVADWGDNLAYIENHKFIIRVDHLEKNYFRYTSWSKPKTISEKPDLVLERQDVIEKNDSGNEAYAFQNGIWTYKVNTPSEKDWLVEVLKNGKKITSFKCQLVE